MAPFDPKWPYFAQKATEPLFCVRICSYTAFPVSFFVLIFQCRQHMYILSDLWEFSKKMKICISSLLRLCKGS